MPGPAPYDARTVAVEIVRLRKIFNENRPVPVQSHFTVNDPTKRRTGAVEF